MKGQLPNENGQCFCQKEQKWTKEGNFYTYKDNSKTKMCKQCLTMHIDNFNPDTFLWLLEDLDVPYVPEEWNVLRDRAFAKDPQKMNGMSVFGKYLSKMKLRQWKEYGWADTERLQALNEERSRVNIAQMDDFVEELKMKYEAGEISEAEYKTLMPTPELQKEIKPTTTEEVYGAAGAALLESQFLFDLEIPDPVEQLTEEDKIYLAMKWGRLYKPSEWIELEKLYTEMLNSFDIQDADTQSSLIIICKLNLKANQALDSGDYDGFTKLSRELGNQRKLANFAAASRKKEEKSDFVDSVGELVAYCEKYGGQIPKFEIDAPLDVVDKIIKDMKDYNRSLIETDTALSRQIEDYLKNRALLDQKRRDKAAAASMDLDEVELTNEDMIAFQQELQKQRELDDITKGIEEDEEE